MHAAAESVGGAGAVVVEAVRLHAPLVVPDEEAETAQRTLQVVVGAEEGSAPRMVKVYSKGGGDEGWVLHAEGRAGSGSVNDLLRSTRSDEDGGEGGAVAAVGSLDVESLRSGLEPMPAESFYEGLAEAGIEPGSGLRVVESVWRGAGEAVLEVVVSPSSEAGAAAGHGGGAAAAVLGGCFDALSVLLGESVAGEVWLGSGWERLWLAEGLPERLVCRVRLRAGGEGSASDVRVGDIELHSVDGAVVGGVRGVELTRTTRAALLSAVSGVEELLYGVAWRERALTGGCGRRSFWRRRGWLWRVPGSLRRILGRRGSRRVRSRACSPTWSGWRGAMRWRGWRGWGGGVSRGRWCVRRSCVVR